MCITVWSGCDRSTVAAQRDFLCQRNKSRMCLCVVFADIFASETIEFERKAADEKGHSDFRGMHENYIRPHDDGKTATLFFIIVLLWWRFRV